MGNSEPSNSKLKVYIETDKIFYNSGDIIQGGIFIEAEDNFDFHALFLRFQGYQFCQWFQGSSKNRRKFTGSSNFYTQQHMIARFQNNTLQKGKYIFPFSMEVSQNIPGTYQSQQIDAKIKYKLVVYFANFDNKNHRHRCQKQIIIRQPFRQEICECQGTSTKNPKKFVFFSQDAITIEANFSRNVAFHSQKIPIRIKCDNSQGRNDIKDICVDLIQYTFVSANNGAFRTYKKKIDTQKVGRTIPKRQKIEDLQINFEINSKKVMHTAISTLVANYFRLEVYPDLGIAASNLPCIFCPLFIMRENYNEEKDPKWSQNIREIDFSIKNKTQVFHAPQFWFKKNRNLDIMNFRVEDNVPIHETQLNF